MSKLPKFALSKNLADLKLSISTFHSYLTFLGIGVIVGFISKRYFKFLFACALISLLIIKGLEYQFILKIDWKSITESVGLDTNLTIEEWISSIYALLIKNIYLSVTAAVGFLIGYRAG